MWLAVSEIVVQGFAAAVVVLVVAGVVAVLGLGSRTRRSGVSDQSSRRRTRLPVGTSGFAVHVDPRHRNGSSRERLSR
jgi:hypothetical protein